MSDINVNMTPCTCGTAGHYQAGCLFVPILIPLSLQPFRSVTFTVRLGECTCAEESGRLKRLGESHVFDCPARPIRVSCSISGETWPDSEVTEAEVSTHPLKRSSRGATPEELTACRERWALVKALVLGKNAKDLWMTIPEPQTPVLVGLVGHRNAVYAALADMARAEEDLNNAAGRSATALRAAGASVPRRRLTLLEMAENDLAAYVSHLIEQVGAL